MACIKVKNEEIEKFLAEFTVKIMESIGDRDLICTNDIHGTFYSPSQRKPFFRTAGFAINKDALIDDSVKPFLNCAPIAFFFLEKGNLKK